MSVDFKERTAQYGNEIKSSRARTSTAINRVVRGTVISLSLLRFESIKDVELGALPVGLQRIGKPYNPTVGYGNNIILNML
jgi:hypothetical protein